MFNIVRQFSSKNKKPDQRGYFCKIMKIMDLFGWSIDIKQGKNYGLQTSKLWADGSSPARCTNSGTQSYNTGGCQGLDTFNRPSQLIPMQSLPEVVTQVQIEEGTPFSSLDSPKKHSFICQNQIKDSLLYFCLTQK